ncbi:MAG: formylglycine-generating enzyme family protein [Rhizobiaceae bacterium]|nr:formylglycine-generating enzyme family protein [Rhizobiaceae bacterium]
MPQAEGRGGNAASAPQLRASSLRTNICWIDGGNAVVGTSRPVLPVDGEGPPRTVRLRPYGIDRFAVSNERFASFVAQTGYVTEAEHFGWSFVFKGFLTPHVLAAAQVAPEAPWWVRVEGACWKLPEGEGSSLSDRKNHPAVHISWNDARAFACWAGGRLPTEAEWEHAAMGGRVSVYPWGDEDPDDTAFFPCNIWQGRFPEKDLGLDGHVGTAPVDAFRPNGFGLYNMVGNTWEWCEDLFRVRSLSRVAKIRNKVTRQQQQRLMKGGSYLCHASYCHRYRIAARLGCPPDSATGHLGFRIAYDVEDGNAPTRSH